ncbi:thioredoxin fold domain-containing protein [Neiella marina]|uniref:Thiol:disulfide interchange protein n=1 Tax=Neiella holothuriorum TaxID=2870530 RepID=A0ABS7EJ35_9GAMM|nr:thioredoxin fold domain-containing protein [Neiella holothuriorum]MBW8192340.1 thioredoxin fold domain-containing protein [Neiella holothuriorum]
MLKLLSALGAIVLSFSVMAQAADVKDDVENRVRAKVIATFGEAPRMIVPAPLPGYTQAVTSQGNFFVSNDGNYMIYGRLFELKDGLVEITDSGLNGYRAEHISELKQDTISYPAKGDEKYSVYVFTDITCGFCRKMHRQIEDYQELGISVHYLAWPRSDQSMADMQKIWCADDKVAALSDAKLHGEVPEQVCKTDDQTVQEQWMMGSQFGVRGTPAIMLDNGAMIPGYREPADLLEALGKLK